MRRRLVAATLTCTLAIIGLVAAAPQQSTRLTNQQISTLLTRTERDAEQFRRNVELSNRTLPFTQARAEDNINRFILELSDTLVHLRDHASRRVVVAADVEDVLNRGTRIDTFMSRHKLTAAAVNSWTRLRRDLDEIADAYGVGWNWTEPQRSTAAPPAFYERFAGTFELDRVRSDNVQRAAELATRSLPVAQRQRELQLLVNRLQPPDTIALERVGDTVTIASTRAPRVTFQADGTSRTEPWPDGRSMTTRATLYGDQLMVESTGNRGNNFTATFEPLVEGSRGLQVTRRVDSAALTQPVTVRTYYREIDTQPRWELAGTPETTGETSSFIVPEGTNLVATLNTALNTQTARQGQRFTVTVTGPPQFEGAIIEGVVSRVDSSALGRKDIVMDFDSIRLRNGRTSAFEGTLDSVLTPDGRTLGVDAPRTNSNQSEKALERGAIGAAVGAIIGALAGGGKGAAIGAVVGGAGGAGTVFIDGRGELDLPRGTELQITARLPTR